jgi:opacity protein-like surface antigen
MRRITLALVLVLFSASSAYADLTAFLGRTTTPSGRPAKGFAIGTGLLVIGFEFEYSDTTNDIASGSPSLKTGTGNMLLQSPVSFVGIQPYFEVGGGIYRETLSTDDANDETSFGTNVGGGVKISLAGPLRVRVDYRVFNLRGTPRHTNAQRFYVGANLKF